MIPNHANAARLPQDIEAERVYLVKTLHEGIEHAAEGVTTFVHCDLPMSTADRFDKDGYSHQLESVEHFRGLVQCLRRLYQLPMTDPNQYDAYEQKV